MEAAAPTPTLEELTHAMAVQNANPASHHTLITHWGP